MRTETLWAVAEATERAAAEVRRGAAELAGISAADPQDQALWDRVLQAQTDRALVMDDRVAALRSGAFDDIRPGAADLRDGEALHALGLERRDCAQV